MAAPVGQTPLQRFLGRRRQFRRTTQRHLFARVQREKLGHVAVPRFGLHEILRPFLDLAVLAYRQGREPRARGGGLLPELRFDAQGLSRADDVRQQIVDNLLAHGRRDIDIAMRAIGRDETVLGRLRRAGDQFAGLGVLDHVIQVELGGLFHHRPGALAEELAVARKGVAFPEMARQPARSALPHGVGREHFDGGVAPYVSGIVRHPAAAAICRARRAAARFAEHVDEIE